MHTPQDIYDLLEAEGIPYEAFEHPAAYTVDDIVSYHLPHPEYGAKNLFVRDDKKRNYYLLVAKDDRAIDLKAFGQRAGTRRLSFASPEDLGRFLGLTPGSVTPFGILNDDSRSVTVFLDAYYVGGMIAVHPNANTATVHLPADALVRLLRAHGNDVRFIDLG